MPAPGVGGRAPRRQLAAARKLGLLPGAVRHVPPGRAVVRDMVVSSVAPGLEFEEVGRPSDKEDEAGPKKGGRIRKPSVRVSGPDWVTA